MKYMRRTAGYTWTDYRTNAIYTQNYGISKFVQLFGNISLKGELDVDKKN